jgi:hypothetical protein
MSTARPWWLIHLASKKNGRQPELPPVLIHSDERYCFIRIVVASLVTSSITDADVRTP